MIEICPNLFIGTVNDYELIKDDGWRVVHAAKEPYHRLALGYTGRSADKNHPEYLIAVREKRLILNLIDAPSASYIPKILIDTALDFIRKAIAGGFKVLVHCNSGQSRAPTIGLLYMASCGMLTREFETSEAKFREIYPLYNPKSGMHEFGATNFNSYL